MKSNKTSSWAIDQTGRRTPMNRKARKTFEKMTGTYVPPRITPIKKTKP